MPRQKYHRERVYQVIGEPGPGARVAGYVRYSSEMQDPATIVTQKRLIQTYATQKGWVIVRWYEEPEHSAKYEEIAERPIFAQLLADAGGEFTVILCYVNNRWARNTAVAFTSLNLLRRKRIWWATADGMWDIDKVQQDGFDVAFAVDTQQNANFVRKLSKVVIDAKESRARDGYHNGQVPFGYLPPEYPKAPDGAPSTWKPPRMPVRRNPATFPALVQIGELAAQGWTDAAIADELSGYFSTTPRYGQRALAKDTIAAIRRLWFPREFAPGCGHGTIETPAGELIEGRHPAAWPYDLWQRIVEAKAGQYR
ncbi:MAG TPA: recombinase family protein, partial [Ktedonobacterales bacterium]|nr:recombinase family protein [Ktedonobacterales bacterium]